MATHRAASTGIDRRVVYVVLAALLALPFVAFAFGPASSSTFSLEGPGGPILAFSAGVLSFISPCVLPIMPIFVAHLSGASVVDGKLTADRRVTFLHAVAFVVGLSVVFIALGTTAGLLGSYFLQDNQRELAQIAGVLLIGMGILLMPAHGTRSPMRSAVVLLVLTAVFFAIASLADLRGDRPALLALGVVIALMWLRFAGYLPLNVFSRTFEVNVGRNRKVGYTRSALVGGAFALGWTPCTGPILGSIITLAGRASATTSDALTGTYLFVAYAAGFSIPFLITGLATSEATRFYRKIAPYTPMIEVVSGIVLVGIGLLLWYGRITSLNSYFNFADFNRSI
jgi:cytochrome c-type biogenesis protein